MAVIIYFVSVLEKKFEVRVIYRVYAAGVFSSLPKRTMKAGMVHVFNVRERQKVTSCNDVIS